METDDFDRLKKQSVKRSFDGLKNKGFETLI